jgi:hypothetical protein
MEFKGSKIEFDLECRRRPDLDSAPERMWTLRRFVCGHLAGDFVDTFAA